MFAAENWVELFAGVRTPGSLAAAMRWDEFIDAQIAWVHAHTKKAGVQSDGSIERRPGMSAEEHARIAEALRPRAPSPAPAKPPIMRTNGRRR